MHIDAPSHVESTRGDFADVPWRAVVSQYDFRMTRHEVSMGNAPPLLHSLFEGYEPLDGTWDEYFEKGGHPRQEAERVIQLLDGLGSREFRVRQKLADATFLRGGITFSVYSDRRGAERIFPFDLIPRDLRGSMAASRGRPQTTRQRPQCVSIGRVR